MTRPVAVSLHIIDNDVDALGGGLVAGSALFWLDASNDDRDAVTVSGNTFVGKIPGRDMAVAYVATISRCSVTGNVILNRETVDGFLSLLVVATHGTIVSNVLRGGTYLTVPAPGAPLTVTPLPVSAFAAVGAAPTGTANTV